MSNEFVKLLVCFTVFLWAVGVGRGVARNLIWVGINEFVLGQGDKTTTSPNLDLSLGVT